MRTKTPSDPKLLSLLETAGEATSPPRSNPIPVQWVPSWIRWPIRCLALPFIFLDLCAQKLAKWLIPPPFKKEGHCLRRGNCCHYILIPPKKGLFGSLYYLWNTQILGFYPREKKTRLYEGKPVIVMGCRYLKEDGSCRHYRWRPTVCRQWPRIEYFGPPQILKGCGFRAVDKN